ncbi:bifunctional DNA primase/polymerase [Alicyclobacillus acidiphilus]|uniref:bifunctional DNA primase/polymerase n=1 Tax=Alicyclobacillus acidiphilus TaxID=182455 RepID=UPI000833D15A|nr:bifunctional DNA primase/polymerase [Alicyclobacillus acidiphilus]
MSRANDNSMPSIASYDTTVVGEESTTSHSDSSSLSGKQKTSLAMFANLKWRLFPTHTIREDGECTCGKHDCEDKGKHPRIYGWYEQATTNLVQLVKWLQQFRNPNWGLACGPESGIWVLDVDPKNGGIESLAKLESEIGPLPVTVRVRTGSGGFHIYFLWPKDGTHITNSVNLKGAYPGLDVRGYRGYVVVPPGKHKSGNRYEWMEGCRPDEVPLAQAPQALIDVIKNASGSRTYADKPRDTRPWDNVPLEVIHEKATSLCARLEYFTSETGARDVSYEDWVTMASWGHAMTDDEGIFQDWSAADPDRHNKDDTSKKWEKTANLAPRSCHRAQADHPLEQCKNCPLFELDKNPAYHVRVAYNRELGKPGPFGAPPPTPEELEQRRTAHQKEREAYMEALQGVNEVAAGMEATAPKIDVMEDDYEGDSSTTKDAGQAHAGDAGAGNELRFRVIDNLEPYLEQSLLLAEKLRNGDDPFNLMPEVARVLAAIKRLAPTRYNAEQTRLMSAECDGRPKGQKARYTTKTIDQAVKSATEHEATQLKQHQGTVGEYWPDAPVEHHHLPIAQGFDCSDEGVTKVVFVGNDVVKEEVSGQPVYVAAPRLNINTGETHMVIMHRTRYAGWQEITELPSVATNPNTVRKLADKSLSVLNAPHMAEYINKCNDLVVNTFGEAPGLQTERLGLHIEDDNVTFVWPDKSVGAKQITPAPQSGTRSFMDNYRSKGDAGSEMSGVFGVLMDFPKTAFAFGVMTAAFLVRAANESQAIEFFGFCAEIVSAKTSVGKSKTLNFSIAPWANPAVIRPLDGTSFAIGEVLYAMSDLPVGFVEAQQLNDNTKGTADAQRIIHALGDGGTRLLGAKTGGLRNANQLHSTFMMANNASVLPDSADDGPRARLLTVNPLVPPGDAEIAASVDSYAELFAKHHGHGGRALVEGVLADCGWSWEKFKDKVSADLKKEIAEIKVPPLAGDIARRVNRRRKLVGLVRLGLKYLMRYAYPDFERIPAEFTDKWMLGIQEVFDELLADERRYERENNTSLRLLDRIGDWVQSELGKVRGCEPKRLVGGVEEPIIPSYYIGAITTVDGVKCIGLYKMRLEDFVNGKYKKSLRALIPEWEEADILVKDKGQTTRKVNKIDPVEKKPFGKMLVFPLESLGLDDLDGGEESHQQRDESNQQTVESDNDI